MNETRFGPKKMSSQKNVGPKNLDTFWCTGKAWNCQIIFRFASIHGRACFILCERQRALYGIKCVLSIFWQTWLGKSKTCNGTKRNEIETKRDCFVSCFSIYLRVITNSRNCFVSFRFRFLSLISKNTHTTFYIYFTISSH